MSEYRYAVDEHGAVTRGRVYSLRDAGYDTSDDWQFYWDCDQMVAFYPDTTNYNAPTKNDDTARAVESFEAARNHGADEDACLTALARRLAGEWGCRDPWAARFITVHLEYDCDLYVLAPDGDPDREWRNEIEAVYHGEVYRMKTWRYDTHLSEWVEDDDYCDQWYGEDKADEALEQMFPETEFPAELLVEDRAS